MLNVRTTRYADQRKYKCESVQTQHCSEDAGTVYAGEGETMAKYLFESAVLQGRSLKHLEAQIASPVRKERTLVLQRSEQ
jgi:hypothetical protein